MPRDPNWRRNGHADLAITTRYTAGLPQRQVIDTMRHRGMPQIDAFVGGGSERAV